LQLQTVVFRREIRKQCRELCFCCASKQQVKETGME
jgi:hypothetical protein